jgi:hypothetical protein
LPLVTLYLKGKMTINIANRRELFVDDYLIERKTNVWHHMHRPTPCETVFKFDKPWEGNACGYSTLLHDGEKYRLYYRGWNYQPELTDKEVLPNNYCVAYSDDGLNFHRPSLGMVSSQGRTDNNIILEGADYHAFAPFIDTRPDTPASERYKAIATTSGDQEGENELIGHVSGDGLTWRPIREEPIIDHTRSAFDSMNLAFWSEHENCYVCYGRSGGEGTRTISRFTSPDFLNWEGPFAMQFAGTALEELYTNGTLPYPRAPHIYLAFPKRFVRGASPLTQEQASELGIISSQRGDVSDGVLLSSRGGDRYDRLFMEAFVPPGRDQCNWAARSLMSVWGMAQTADDELSLYYQQHYGLTTASVKRYSLRTDGFISLRAPWHGGEMVTKPLQFSGKALTMNFATSAAGSVKVEIQRPSGQPIPGYTLEDATEIAGDSIEQQVAWKTGADLSELAGQPIRLRFVMRDADLYSFRFAE